MKHYYKEFIAKYTPHFRRDLWSEFPNFLDQVVSDVWKIDDRFLVMDEKFEKELDELKVKNPKAYEKKRVLSGTAYALQFSDMKTAYPLQTLICPHSVTGSDVKKGMLSLIINWGPPCTWLLDNGHEFINEKTMDFLYGVHMGIMGELIEEKRPKVIVLKEDNNLITSTPYHPQGKGRQERIFRILKDEWAAYSKSYSPNQFESRKPDLKLSMVEPEHNLNELAASLKMFLDTDYITREREMFFNPKLSKLHPDNKNRPRTIKEAFERAYATYIRRDVDEYLLSYHYADKIEVPFKDGSLTYLDKLSLEYVQLIPDDYSKIMQYAGQKLTVLLNPKNRLHAWIFRDDTLITEAHDISKSGDFTNERASTIGKLRRKVIATQKKELDLIDQIEAYKPEPATLTYDDAVKVKEEPEIFSNNSEQIPASAPTDDIWDLLTD